MATPQGNASAYNQLKPVEPLKVGELYSGVIDYMIKDRKAKEAAELKRKTDEGKRLSDLMKDWKVDYKSTITPFQDVSNQSVKKAVDKIHYAQTIAGDPNYTWDEQTKASQFAKNAMDSSLQLQTFLTNPKTLENYQNNLKLIGDGKAYSGDDRLGLYNSAAIGTWKSRFNDDGTIDVAYAKQNDTKDSPLEWHPLTNIIEKYSTPIEESQTDGFDKKMFDYAQKITTETTNDNGVLKTHKIRFDENDAKALLMQEYGFGNDKPLNEAFGKNLVKRDLNQKFYQKYGKEIETPEEFQTAIDDSLLQMKASADEKTSVEVKKTGLDQEEQRLRIANAKKNLYKTDNPDKPVAAFIQNTDGIVRILKSADGTGASNGTGAVYKNGLVINLKNGKENLFGFKVPNANGKGFHTEYTALGKDENGRLGFKETMSRQNAASILGGYGYDFDFIDKRILNGETVDNSQKVKTSVQKLKEFNQSSEFKIDSGFGSK